MSFIADKQTLEDLNLLGKYKPHSVYSLFNAKVQTTGGERLLEAMFARPLSDEEAINQRSKTFQYFEQKALAFPFNREQLDSMHDYLSGSGGSNILSAFAGALRKKVAADLMHGEAYGILYRGLLTTMGVLNDLMSLVDKLDEECPFEEARRLKDILGSPRLAWLREEKSPTGPVMPTARPIIPTARPRNPIAGPTNPAAAPLPLRKVAQYDHLLRHVFRQEMEQLTQGIYQLDVQIAVARVSKERGFSYGWALPRETHRLSASAISHPGIAGAVANPLTFDKASNMLFLTGANMAGKSTFMKSFGIAVYMAHMGFPVAAKEMVFSVKDGIYSSINVPDNLSQGYSHFYAEVLRVKTVAQEVAAGKDLVVIFDELFKGTNVKDAYDATLAVTAAFSKYRNCSFIISTHIIEVGDALKDACDNLQFAYLPTIMEGMIPRYIYKMQQGLTSDRHGMLIIDNEGILDIIQS